MKVLLTGASGFLGRYMLESLWQHQIRAVTVGRRRASESLSVEFIEADMLTTENYYDLVKGSGATHLLHLAWYAEHGKYWTSPLNLRWVDATVRLVEAFCKTGGQHVIVAGTCAEYDWSYGYCREASTPLNPQTIYGIAKDTTRRLVVALCEQFQVPCAWGRIFLPFGYGESRERLIPSLIDALQGKRAPFPVNGSAYRDFLHAYDVAEGFIALLRSGVSGAYNISSGQPVQIKEIVCTIAQLLNVSPDTVLDLMTDRPNDPPLLVGENIRLKTLGWQPALSIDEGLFQETGLKDSLEE